MGRGCNRTQITVFDGRNQMGDPRDPPDLTVVHGGKQRRATRFRRPEAWPARMRQEVAADYMGVSLSYFRQQVKDGVYPAHFMKEGRLKFWHRSDLDDYLDNNRLDTEVEADDPWSKASL